MGEKFKPIPLRDIRRDNLSAEDIAIEHLSKKLKRMRKHTQKNDGLSLQEINLTLTIIKRTSLLPYYIRHYNQWEKRAASAAEILASSLPTLKRYANALKALEITSKKIRQSNKFHVYLNFVLFMDDDGENQTDGSKIQKICLGGNVYMLRWAKEKDKRKALIALMSEHFKSTPETFDKMIRRCKSDWTKKGADYFREL